MDGMQGMQTAPALPQGAGTYTLPQHRRRLWRGGLHGTEYTWAVAFCIPYMAIFLAFVIYPVLYGLWMGHSPALYEQLWEDPIYRMSIVNTIIYLAVGVNVKLFFALLLSGFFMRKQLWVKGLLVIFVLPWAVPALPTFLSIHWMLNSQWGLLDNMLWNWFHIDGPQFLDTSRWLALGSVIVAYIWKWMPFWTVILLAGRMAIPQELYESAEVDGATGIRQFTHVTFPLLANLYLICTLLSTIFTMGDFTTVYFVSGGGPALTTNVLATLGIRDAYTVGQPDVGMAAVMTALPLLIPLVLILMRKMRTAEVQL
ncbi:MAG TPA: sugar ABC transporter permease [Acetobacteraceae bacterium]|jgi:multiple sugar transport system permease protein|nr:sugar ABC transporter permease [Acetobacteraceae bacterium]